MTVLEEVATTALDRVVQAARRLEEHEEVDRWELADDVRDAVDERWDSSQNRFDNSEAKATHTGFNEAIDEVNSALYDAGVISVGRESIVGSYTTAKVWPAETRVGGATYWAHFELRGKDWNERRQRVLARLVAESKNGRVGPQIVRTWKASVRPTDLTPFLEKVDRRVRGAIKSVAAPWDRVAPGDREQISGTLRRIADEIQAGEF